MNRRAFLVIATVAVVVLTLISFLVRALVPDLSQKTVRADKSELVYTRAKEFLKAGENDKAANVFVIAVSQFPGSPYAEKSLRELGALYENKGDNGKAAYYYRRLVSDFPGAADADAVRKKAGELNMKMLLSPEITADSVEYAVQKGDTLSGIAARFNSPVALIKKINELVSDTIVPGQKLKINVSKFSILVIKSGNALVLKKDGEPFKTYTISTGKDNSTPVGKFKVEEKSARAVWYRPDGKVIAPDSPEYELGTRWIGLSAKGYGIHGTKDESSIGRNITMGCVRMRNADVEELYDIIPRGTEVEITE